MVDAAHTLTHWLGEHFLDPRLLCLLGVVLALLLIWRKGEARRQRSMQTWAGQIASDPQRPRRWTRLGFIISMLLVVIASAGPLGGFLPHAPELLGHRIFVVVDVSRSMLAEDRPPTSRLQRVRKGLRTLLNEMQSQSRQDRVGIIIFAGQARVFCPLTTDYDHVRYCIDQLHPDLFSPSTRLSPSTPEVGTSYLPAIRLARQEASPAEEGFAHCLLFTDGEDLSTDGPAAAQAMRSPAMYWTIFGIGDPLQAVGIPTSDPLTPYLMENDPQSPGGRKVMTKRNDERLLQMSKSARASLQLETDSTSTNVRNWWQAVLQEPASNNWEAEPRSLREHLYIWCLWPVFILLTIELIWGEGFRSRKSV